MKKQFVAVGLFLLFCSVLAVPILLQYPWASQGDFLPRQTIQPPTQTPVNIPKTTPQNTPITKPTNTPQPTQQTNSQTTPEPSIHVSNRTLDQAIANATMYLQNTTEPYALLWLNVAYRRFNITLFNDTLQRYDQSLTQSPQENLPMFRLFRRIADYNNPVQSGDLQAVTSETDKLTVPALYCNRYGLPSNYAEKLAQVASSQDYMVTHALLATIWVHENGVDLYVPDGFYTAIYLANAALINNDVVVTDLELEAAAFLCMAGQNFMVNPQFIQNVVAAQNIDGGWQASNITVEGSNWHSSVLGLLLLLHEKYPAASYPSMLAPEQN